ncbi:uncharacterized protein LOC143344918 [Colletes latitarsis]|uniref:uncharacterized protein LOC143344918 n=1 Tax=Colletes latitarsis TaxID=2605962 RepID=UPI004035E01E
MRISAPSDTSFIEAPVDAEIDDKGLMCQLEENDPSAAEEVKYTLPYTPAVQTTPPTEIIFDLGQDILRIPAHIPTTTRRYSCPVPGGRYVLRWTDYGRLSSCILKLDRKDTQSVTTAKPSAIPRTADSQWGRTWTQRKSKRSRSRRGSAQRREDFARIVIELVHTTLRILRNAGSPPIKRQNGATGR